MGLHHTTMGRQGPQTKGSIWPDRVCHQSRRDRAQRVKEGVFQARHRRPCAITAGAKQRTGKGGSNVAGSSFPLPGVPHVQTLPVLCPSTYLGAFSAAANGGPENIYGSSICIKKARDGNQTALAKGAGNPASNGNDAKPAGGEGTTANTQ